MTTVFYLIFWSLSICKKFLEVSTKSQISPVLQDGSWKFKTGIIRTIVRMNLGKFIKISNANGNATVRSNNKSPRFLNLRTLLGCLVPQWPMACETFLETLDFILEIYRVEFPSFCTEGYFGECEAMKFFSDTISLLKKRVYTFKIC